MFRARFPALFHRNFLIFWTGQFISLIGTWMQNTIQPYLAYSLTSQPIYLGLIGFAGSLPALLLMLPGGVLVERVDKRKAVIFFQSVMMVQAFLLAYLTLTGQVTIWHIIGLALVLGVANAVEITARQAMLTDLVPKEAIPNAIALNSTVFNLARVLGPSLTAPFLIILKTQGEGWGFFANGVSYLFVIIGLLFVTTRFIPSAGQVKRRLLQDFQEGQKYIRATPLVGVLILMVTIPGFFGFPAMQQIPVFARDVLRVAGESEAGVATRNSLIVTAQGAGALIAALTLAVFSSMRRKGLALMIGQFVFAAGLICLSLSRYLPLSLAAMVLIGWGTVTQLALTNTLIQLVVPDNLRGRVISTYLWAMQGVAPFGSLFTGWLAQTFGAPAAVLAGGSIVLAAYTTFHIFRPSIRQATG